MISIVRAKERFHDDIGWLATYWHFSFSHYQDPNNMGWGALRVFNDDTVMPGGKFGLHPHSNYEIITVVLAGAIAHADNAGNKGVTSANDVQVMTAGRGIAHSEANPGREPLKLLQIWIEPSEMGLEPSWAQETFKDADFQDRLCPLVSGVSGKRAPLHIHQAATIYRSKLSAGKSIVHPTPRAPTAIPAPKASEYNYLFVISGSLSVNGHAMSAGDSAKIKDEPTLTLTAEKAADFILFDLPGYSN